MRQFTLVRESEMVAENGKPGGSIVIELECPWCGKMLPEKKMEAMCGEFVEHIGFTEWLILCVHCHGILELSAFDHRPECVFIESAKWET